MTRSKRHNPLHCKRGQSAVEAGLIMMVVLVLASGFVGVLSGQIGEAHVKNYEGSLATLAALVETEINIALAAENGYTHEFRLPPTLAGKPYKIEFINFSTLNEALPEEQRYKYNASVLRVYAVGEGATFMVEKTFQRLEGDFVKGLNILTKEEGSVMATPQLEPGVLIVTLDNPTSDIEVKKPGSFGITATATCTANPKAPGTSCGDEVSMSALQESGSEGEPIPTSGTPFTSTSPTEHQCGELLPGQTCQHSWTVTSTGGANDYNRFFVKARSPAPYNTKAESAHFKATIMPYCIDDTYADTCSTAKPKYCQSSDLILTDKCSACGCNPGYTCSGDETCKTYGRPAATLLMPTADMSLSTGKTFILKAKVTCSDSLIEPSTIGCGTVDITAYQELEGGSSPQKLTTTTTPLATLDSNPQSCGEMAIGQTCEIPWTVKVTGAPPDYRYTYAKAASSYGEESTTVKKKISAASFLVGWIENAMLDKATYVAARDGNYVYVTADNRFVVVNTIPKSTPTIKSSVSHPNLAGATSIAPYNWYAYVPSPSMNSLSRILTWSPASPKVDRTITDATKLKGAKSVFVASGYVFVSAYDANRLGMYYGDLSSVSGGYYDTTVTQPFAMYMYPYKAHIATPTSLVIRDVAARTTLSTLSVNIAQKGFAGYRGSYVFVYFFDNLGRFTIVDATDPYNPYKRGTIAYAGMANAKSIAAVSGTRAYVASGENLVALDVSNPDSPSIIGTFSDAKLKDAVSVAVYGDYAYVVSDKKTLSIIDLAYFNP